MLWPELTSPALPWATRLTEPQHERAGPDMPAGRAFPACQREFDEGQLAVFTDEPVYRQKALVAAGIARSDSDPARRRFPKAPEPRLTVDVLPRPWRERMTHGTGESRETSRRAQPSPHFVA